jgi:hypothetical protein
VKGRAQRLATKPVESRARMGVRPIRSATPVVAARASSELSSPATTSTSSISAGGLKKCMPTTRSGPGTAEAIAVTESEDVLVASTALGPQTLASRSNRCRFRSRSSGAASIASSHPSSTSMIVSPRSLFSAAVASSSVQRSRSTPRRMPLRICSIPFARASESSS